MKGVLPEQLENLGCQIILSNTYHLGNRPGINILSKAGGLHKFMGWNRGLLTDSGGFQMVSLLKLATITEEGVKFQSPYNDSEIMLTPEHSIEIQNCIGLFLLLFIILALNTDAACVGYKDCFLFIQLNLYNFFYNITCLVSKSFNMYNPGIV